MRSVATAALSAAAASRIRSVFRIGGPNIVLRLVNESFPRTRNLRSNEKHYRDGCDDHHCSKSKPARTIHAALSPLSFRLATLVQN
jgi:hypothetical protein